LIYYVNHYQDKPIHQNLTESNTILSTKSDIPLQFFAVCRAKIRQFFLSSLKIYQLTTVSFVSLHRRVSYTKGKRRLWPTCRIWLQPLPLPPPPSAAFARSLRVPFKIFYSPCIRKMLNFS
jgi:hypothetical protein